MRRQPMGPLPLTAPALSVNISFETVEEQRKDARDNDERGDAVHSEGFAYRRRSHLTGRRWRSRAAVDAEPHRLLSIRENGSNESNR